MLRLNMKGMVDSFFYGWFFLLGEVLPFMGFPYIWCEVTINCLLQFNRHYHSRIARVRLVKSLLFQIILLWRNCFIILLQQCLLWIEMLTLLVEIVELQYRGKIYLYTNRAAVVELFIVQNVPISLLNQEMI